MTDASDTDDVARYNQVCNAILLSSASSNGQPARASFFTTSCGRGHDAQVHHRCAVAADGASAQVVAVAGGAGPQGAGF